MAECVNKLEVIVNSSCTRHLIVPHWLTKVKKKAKLPIIYLLINILSSEFDQIMEGICRNIGLYGRAVYDFLEIFEYCCWGIGDKQPNQ